MNISIGRHLASPLALSVALVGFGASTASSADVPHYGCKGSWIGSSDVRHKRFGTVFGEVRYYYSKSTKKVCVVTVKNRAGSKGTSTYMSATIWKCSTGTKPLKKCTNVDSSARDTGAYKNQTHPIYLRPAKHCIEIDAGIENKDGYLAQYSSVAIFCKSLG
ncbi:hypothetical protein [Streptomyces echinatus]|uniref:hypothetical protein n=1 Tax=Streptomyces echinatus TaxID=67293 RepID=UPI0037AE2DF4